MRPTDHLRRISVPIVFFVLIGFGAGCASEGGDTESSTNNFGHIHGLAVDPLDPSLLWVATHNGLFRGSAEDNWTYVGDDRSDHMGFTVEPTTATLYRSGHPETGGNLGVESSTDGKTWELLSEVADPPVDFHAMALSYAEPEVMFGWDSGGRGLFRSSDGGRSWEALFPQGLQGPILSLAGPAKKDLVYAGTTVGLFRSNDSARTWNPVIEQGATTVAASPTDANHLYIYTEQKGMQISTDGGQTFTSASAGIPDSEVIGAIAISGEDPQRAYAAGATTIYQTTDGGDSWFAIRKGS